MRAVAMTDACETHRGGRWSDEDIRHLILLWSQGKSNSEIGKKLGREENAVAVKASRLRLPPKSRIEEAMSPNRARNSKAKVRACLRCRSQFFSEGPGNRVCDLCKSSSDWNSSGSYTFQFGGVY